eukprot:m.297128 g.297128  ORF g.297128 m.297128 type:complete len:329 (-) comp20075_c1_seq9:615-1601(-)
MAARCPHEHRHDRVISRLMQCGALEYSLQKLNRRDDHFRKAHFVGEAPPRHDIVQTVLCVRTTTRCRIVGITDTEASLIRGGGKDEFAVNAIGYQRVVVVFARAEVSVFILCAELGEKGGWMLWVLLGVFKVELLGEIRRTALGAARGVAQIGRAAGVLVPCTTRTQNPGIALFASCPGGSLRCRIAFVASTGKKHSSFYGDVWNLSHCSQLKHPADHLRPATPAPNNNIACIEIAQIAIFEHFKHLVQKGLVAARRPCGTSTWIFIIRQPPIVAAGIDLHNSNLVGYDELLQSHVPQFSCKCIVLAQCTAVHTCLVLICCCHDRRWP